MLKLKLPFNRFSPPSMFDNILSRSSISDCTSPLTCLLEELSSSVSWLRHLFVICLFTSHVSELVFEWPCMRELNC